MSRDVPRRKRLLDLVLLAVIVPIAVPVGAVTALVVRARLGRPVLFTQQRPGLHGEIFTLYKFRTMRPPVGDPEADTDEARLGRVGATLRKLSLDELPELWNILRGHMSFVGPRPLLTEYLPLYSPRQRTRHDVLPGLTGLAQVEGRNAIDWDARLELDATYVEQWSLRRDLAILMRTVKVVLAREGIAEEGHVTRSRFTGSNLDQEAS